MEVFAGMGIVAIILFIIVPILIGSLFLYLGASVAGIEDKSFGKAIGAFILSWLVVVIISAIFSLVPVIGTILGFIVGIILSVLIIKSIFKTSTGKAFIALLLAWVLYVITWFILALVFGLSMATMWAT